MSLALDTPPLPDVVLAETDGEPWDSAWHRDEINLLVEQVRSHHGERRDYFVGGNMFVYFSLDQVRKKRTFRGPDFFYVEGVAWNPLRPYYVVWDEDGRYPNVIIELLSPSTATEDRTTKKDVYERTFRTPEYFCYDPETGVLDGWRLLAGKYEAIPSNEEGRLWSEQLQFWLGKWKGEYQKSQAVWLRFYDKEGRLVPLLAETEQQQAEVERQRAEAERQRAEAERQRAEKEHALAEAARKQLEAADAEIARLRSLLAEKDKSDIS
jgi:Uma2 family endonuclease